MTDNKRNRKRVVRFNGDDARLIVLGALQRGHTRAMAAQLAGISLKTLKEWITSDNEFRTQVERAEQLPADMALEAIIGAFRDADKLDWRAAAWLLERRFPGDWGEAVRVQSNLPPAPEVELVSIDQELVISQELERLVDGTRNGTGAE